jgi:hypothetical protein
MQRDENEFQIRIGRSAADVRPALKQVRAAVRHAPASKPKGSASTGQSPVRAHFAKGSASRARPVRVTQRRVVVKARFVAHVAGQAKTLRAHVAYLGREGAARPNQPEVSDQREPSRGQEQSSEQHIDATTGYLSRERQGGDEPFYDQSRNSLDARETTQGWHVDKRHFRLIISAEDGADLGALRPFIRETMSRLERHVGTRLQWLAVDHWDTDNPHTHVLVRGIRADGKDLIIPGKVLSVAIREDAQEIATRILGPRPALELQRTRDRDIGARALTRLDRELIALDGPGGLGSSFRHTDLLRRLDTLSGWGLAAVGQDGSWRLASDLPAQLRQMAESDEVARIVARQGRGHTGMPVLAADTNRQESGRLVAMGYSDDGADNLIAIIENGRGELRYTRFREPGALAVLEDTPKGALIAFEPQEARIGPSDEAVARVARLNRGLYSADIHARMEGHVPDGLVAANIRRLEAMRRAGLISRGRDGIFDIAPDHLDRVLAYERARLVRAPMAPRVQSYMPLANQIAATGPTHLDRALAGLEAAPDGAGHLAREFEAALRQRRLFLIEAGWMGAADKLLPRQALEDMRAYELRTAAKKLAGEIGMPVRLGSGTVSGVYERRIDLAQGRVALIIGDQTAQLVPWRPALERFAGQNVIGVQRGRSISWSLQRGRGLGLGI